MNVDLFIWFIVLAVVVFAFDRALIKWTKKKCLDTPNTLGTLGTYSETGVENESNENHRVNSSERPNKRSGS
jgi:hypothetical protein